MSNRVSQAGDDRAGGTGPSTLSDGTVLAPAYSFTSDTDTGIFNAADDQLALAAGSIEALRLTEVSSAVLAAFQSNVGLTADVGSAQGNGVILSTYNVYSTVGTAGDAATLPATFIVGTQIYIKNDGANSMDVFPASGDTITPNAVNIAVAVAAGTSATFITTLADTTWTQLIEPPAGGGGDVTKVGTPVNNQVGVWTGDGTIEGDANITWTGTAFEVGGTIQVSNASGPALLNEVSSNINPTLIPNNSAPNSGLGGISGQPSLIANGKSGMSVNESGGVARIGFYDRSPIAKQTGVSVTTSAVHAALVSLGLISA